MPTPNSLEMMFGTAGTSQDGVRKTTFPRHDLRIRVHGIPIEPEFALTSWIAFLQEDGKSILAGDLVLLQAEVDPTISQVLADGLEIAALHNHLLEESPRVMYLHISGVGDAANLAKSINDAYHANQVSPKSRIVRRPLPKDYWNEVERIMGKKGVTTGRVLQLSYPRGDIVTEGGVVIPPSMGISQAINFQAEGRQVATTGDFVLIADEVNPVVRILREDGISITALHNHMLYESPRLFFLHFWAVGDPVRLAYALRQALGRTNSVVG